MKERVKNILLSEDYFIFNKRFVKVLGLEPTFLLINLIEGADILKTKDGWFFQTFKLLEELTGLNRRRQERAIEVLIEFGIVSKKKMGVPCRRYFKINNERLKEVLRGESGEKEKSGLVKEEETKILEECVDRKLINGRRIDKESLLSKVSKDSVVLYDKEDKEYRELLKENLLGLEEREELKENNNFQKEEGKIIEEIGFEDNKEVCPKEPYSLNEKYNIVCSKDTDSLDEKSIQDCSNCTDSLYQENNIVCSKGTNRFVPDKQTYKEININKIDKEINIKIDRSINDSQKKNFNNFQKKYSAKASSIDQNFKNNILNFKEIIINSTKTPKEIVNNLVFNMVSILREYDLNTLIEKIKESDFLMGKLEIKPRITNFTRKNMIDRIMADEYKNRDYHKKEEKIDYGRVEREIDPRTEELYRMLGLS